MILPGMTPLEVLREARADLRSVENKMQRAKEVLARRHRKGDRKAIFTAASAANKAAEYLLSRGGA